MALNILIPARGGSKRIPKKNLVDVNGKPLLYYTINTCRKITENIWVSTDDDDIRDFAESMNVNVIDRPERLATDESKTEDVVEHFLEEIDTDLFCVVQPTSPLLSFTSILEGIDKLVSPLYGVEQVKSYDSVISVCKDVNYYWDIDGKPINFELGNRKRTQEHTPWFRENGAFYLTYKNNFLENKILQNGKVGFVEMHTEDSIDIDDEHELELVRRITA